MVNAKRMLALIMAGTFLFQSSLAVGAAGWNGQVSQVMTTGEQEVVTVEGISVEARFSSNHIRFNAVEGATGYNIWRCAEQEGGYEKINSEVIPATTYSYVDEDAGTGTKLWYKVEAVKASGNTFVGPTQDQYETGVDAVHQHAKKGQLHRDYINADNTLFDGERMETGTEDELNRIKDLNIGTVLVTYKPENASGRKALLVLKKKGVDIPVAGNMTGGIGFYQDANKTRVDFSNSMRAAWDNTGAANTWNTFGFVSGPYTGTAHNVVTSWNGNEKLGYTNEGLTGLFGNQSDLESITIGAVQNSSGKAMGYTGEIAYITVTDEVFTQEELNAYTQEITKAMRKRTGISLTDVMLSTAYDDTTWVFVGGEAVSGGYHQVGNVRNYVGQYEEYIRWGRILGTPINNRQRFVINAGKPGRTLADIVENYDELVTAFRPRVVSYLVGKEDYEAGEEGLETFKANLKAFIDKSLTQKDYEEDINQQFAFAVIQKPFAAKDEATNAIIQKYCEAVDEVKAGYTGGQASGVVVVDHFTQTNNDTFKNNKLIIDGILNVDGHYEIGKQLAATAFGDTSGYWGGSIYSENNVRPMEEQPMFYMPEVLPQATATANSLQVAIPEGDGWAYELEVGEMTIRGTATANVTISPLPSGEDYVLKVRSEDGSLQLGTVKGRIEEGNTAVKNTQVLNDNQQRLAQMMESKDKMTWLFMGDSITHGARFTNGYDSVPQLFEKFIRDELGRTDDIIVNSAVANGNTISTMENIVQRLENYTPDVVSIMLGTNDAYPNVATLQQYEQNMREIVERIMDVMKMPLLSSVHLPTLGMVAESIQFLCIQQS
ncbi:MAG: hypothetical protein IKM28_03045 [Lachnospiraceae bacterium]|nr:hypothetical protein [Lachnospiraceae bacterium]